MLFIFYRLLHKTTNLPPDEKLIAKPFAVPIRCGSTELLTKIFNARNASAMTTRQIKTNTDNTTHKIVLKIKRK